MAHACLRALSEPFELDHTLAGDDSERPEPFRDVTALTHRVAATRCSNGACTEHSCGDSGMLELRFQAPAEAELGYRVVWLSGDWPEAVRESLDRVLPLSAASDSLTIELGWRGVTELEGELALVAVDRAGNESEPSEPVRVSWSGCTDFYDEPFCVDGGSMSRSAASCTVTAGRRSPLIAALLFGFVALILARNRR